MTGILGAPRAWLESSPTRWYLVFTSARGRYWWNYVFRTPPGFEHVYALRWDGWNWLLYNPGLAFTDVAIVDATDETALARLVDAGATVLEVEAFRNTDQVRGRWWIGPMTCVEQVKALLGLPVGWIFTPWQLYQYLLRGSEDGKQRRHRADTVRPAARVEGGQGQQGLRPEARSVLVRRIRP